MGDFELDTRVEGSNGKYTAAISPDWRAWGPAGGYVAAIALRAAGMEANIKRPASFSGHFIRFADYAPVDIDVTPVHSGRRAESIHVVIRQAPTDSGQEPRPILQAIVRTAAEGPGLEHDVTQMPDVPPPHGLKTFLDLVPDPGGDSPFWENIESRIIQVHRLANFPDSVADTPDMVEWYRFRPTATFDDPFVDAGRALLFMDVMASFAATQPHPNSDYQVPNIDVTCWFHQPAHDAEWLLVEYEAPIAKGALMGATGRVWAEDGRLIASGGSQMLCITPGAGVPMSNHPKTTPAEA
ncbi:MAG: thioesterase family protein [Chloroflexi bacterium]|nr:thioesterase family protein [Chloroflexota bacterium]